MLVVGTLIAINEGLYGRSRMLIYFLRHQKSEVVINLYIYISIYLSISLWVWQSNDKEISFVYTSKLISEYLDTPIS